MGDTGSLWIGFSLSALLIIAVRNMRSPIGINPLPGFPPSMIYGLIIVPVFDLVRVFFIRLIGRRSPFKADRNHIHHLMIDRMGMSHLQATFTIVTANLFLFAVIYFSGYFLPEAALLGIFGILFIVYNAALYAIESYRAVSRKPVSVHHRR